MFANKLLNNIMGNNQSIVNKCEAGHKLIQTYRNPYSRPGVICNACRLTYIEDREYLLHCNKCRYDLCKDCARGGSAYIKGMKKFKCPNNHQLNKY